MTNPTTTRPAPTGEGVTNPPTVERMLNVARGCHDYGGGHHNKLDAEIYHHGIQTVINALEGFLKNANDTQCAVLERVGRAAAPGDATAREGEKV